MAFKTITLDATSGTSTSGTSLTFSHTNAGNLLVVGVNAGTSDVVTGVTFNGVSMSRLPTNGFQSNGNSTAYMYYLLAPSIGTFNIVISTSASVSINGNGVSFKNAKQSIPDATTANVASATTTCANTLTTTVDNAVHVALWGVDAFGITSVTNGTTFGVGNMAYSNPLLITPAGSHTLTANAAGNNSWASVGASFAPALVDEISGAFFDFLV